MGKIKLKLDIKGLNEVLRSEGVQNLVTSEAQKIRDRAGPEFEVRVRPGDYTARAYVTPSSYLGMHQEAKDGRLSKAVVAQ